MTALHWNGGPTGKPYLGSKMNVSTVADDKWLIDCSGNASLTALNSRCLLNPFPLWYNHTYYTYNESSHAWNFVEILVLDIKEWLHIHCFLVFFSFFGNLSLKYQLLEMQLSLYNSFLVPHKYNYQTFCRLAYAHLGAMHFTSGLYFQAPK